MKDDTTMRFGTLSRAATVLVALTGCSKSTPPSSPATTPPAAGATAPAASASRNGRVAGTAAAGAIVILEPKTPREFPPPEQAVMDQVSLSFTPDMLFVRTGVPVEFRNSDDTLHNVHVGNVDTKEPSFNVAIPTGEVYRYTFPKDGFYHVGCDIHPAMSAEILSVSTPFVAVAAADGSFSFDGVMPGAWVLRSYASGVKKEKAVDIVGGPNTIAI
jgi:plastocyanin